MRTPSSAWHAYVKSARRPTLAKISQTTGHALALSRRTLKRPAHLYGATLSRLRLTSGHKHQKELRSRSSITRDSLASCGNAHDRCLHEWRLLKQGCHKEKRWGRWPSKHSAACNKGMSPTKRHRRKRRCSSWSLFAGALAAALLARLLGHRPRCPGASQKLPASPKLVQMNVNLTVHT